MGAWEGGKAMMIGMVTEAMTAEGGSGGTIVTTGWIADAATMITRDIQILVVTTIATEIVTIANGLARVATTTMIASVPDAELFARCLGSIGNTAYCTVQLTIRNIGLRLRYTLSKRYTTDRSYRTGREQCSLPQDTRCVNTGGCAQYPQLLGCTCSNVSLIQ